MDVRGDAAGTSANPGFNHAEQHAPHSANLGPNQAPNPILSISRGPSAVPKHVQRPLVSEFGSGTTLTDMESSKPPRSRVAGSLYSYKSTRDIAGFLKELHGRTFNTMNDAYLLPSDEPEWGRLDKQHSALVIGMGGLFPCPIELVKEVLDSGDEGETKRILDVGCGTGTWAIQVAQMFPTVQVLGIDLAPVPQDAASFPPNLAFELDDVNHGLSGHYGGYFNIIQMRCVMSGIKDMDATLHDLELCLKPGGLLIVIDGDYPCEESREGYAKLARLDGDGDVSGTSEKGSWFRRMMFEAIEGSRLAGTAQNLAPWIIDTGPWDHELCDPDSTATGSLFLPIGPWAKGASPQETQMLQFAGILMRQTFLNIIRAWNAVLLRYGIPQETVDHWTNSAEKEIVKTNPRMWIRYRFFWTRRKPVERVEATAGTTPAVPVVEAAVEKEPMARYPAFETYHTKEEAVSKMAKRKKSLGLLPKSAVARAWAASNPGGDHSRTQSMTSSQE